MNRRLAGLILIASALVLALMAVLAWTGVLPFAEEVRLVVALALAAAAVADALVAVRVFLVAPE
jgi:hypothetical protein